MEGQEVSPTDSLQLLQQLKDVCVRVKEVFNHLTLEEKSLGLDALQATVSKIVSNMKPSITGVKFELECAAETVSDFHELLRTEHAPSDSVENNLNSSGDTGLLEIKQESDWEGSREEQQILEILPQEDPPEEVNHKATSPDRAKKKKSKTTPKPPKTKKQKQSRGWENRKIKCPQCPYGSDEQWEMDIHLIAHSKDKEIKCQLCLKEFTAIATLKRHIMSHYGIKPFECRECKKRFVDQTSLKTHIKVHMNSGPRKHNCETCGKEFTHLSNLIRHRRQHEEQTKFKCDQCPSKFNDKSSLDVHIASHKGQKLYPCSFCGKQFRSKKGLKYHENNHQGAKGHVCDICKKPFPTAQNLKQHKVTHSKLKSFVCGHCEAAFNVKSNLKRHLKICTADQQLKCQYCEQNFESFHSLQYHESIHTGKRLVCSKCGFTCRSNKALKNHKCPKSKRAKKKKAQEEDDVPLSVLKCTGIEKKGKVKKTAAEKQKKLVNKSPIVDRKTKLPKTKSPKGIKTTGKKAPLVIKFNMLNSQNMKKIQKSAEVFENEMECTESTEKEADTKEAETEASVAGPSRVSDSGTDKKDEKHRRKSSTPRRLNTSTDTASDSGDCDELANFVKTEDDQVNMEIDNGVNGSVMINIQEQEVPNDSKDIAYLPEDN